MPSPLPNLVPRSQKSITIVVLFALGLLLTASVSISLYRSKTKVSNINYTQLHALGAVAAGSSLIVEGDTLRVIAADGTISQALVTNEAAQHEVVETFRKNNVPIEFRPSRAAEVTMILNWLLPVVIVFAFAVIGWRLYASMNGGGKGFRLVDAKGKQDVTFADVAGVDEAKAELAETIEFLRDPGGFGRLGGRAPRGILLSGPPGTGKTLLARAAANEAGVPFLAVSGSSFQEKFAGLGAARVRRLFAEARKLSPCLIFIDELDALGRQRGRGADSASADQDQTLNQLLVEMDGFERASGVAVIGSTNRPDILDSALTRPGRFDREIAVNLADSRGRREILQVHAHDLCLEPDLDLDWIARGTPGFSGADLANLLNEAAIAATRDGAESIARPHVEQARDKILMGAERQGFLLDDEERYATAVHEAGHVAVGLTVKNADPIHKVTILPRGRALGVTQSLPERDRWMKKREYLEDQIAMLLGGRAAEEILLSTMTAGAANDIERAVEIARRMVAEFGMSPLGPIHIGKPDEQHSQALLDRIEKATSEIITAQMRRACEAVNERRQSIHLLVDGLMEKDTLDSSEILRCFETEAAAA
jgi:cell division protease FtsH